MTEHRVPGRSLVTRRALVDIIRPAVAGMRYQPAPPAISAAAPDPGPGEEKTESVASVDEAMAAAVDDGGDPG